MGLRVIPHAFLGPILSVPSGLRGAVDHGITFVDGGWILVPGGPPAIVSGWWEEPSMTDPCFMWTTHIIGLDSMRAIHVLGVDPASRAPVGLTPTAPWTGLVVRETLNLSFFEPQDWRRPPDRDPTPMMSDDDFIPVTQREMLDGMFEAPPAAVVVPRTLSAEMVARQMAAVARYRDPEPVPDGDGPEELEW